MSENGREDSELNYKVRVTEIWVEEFKAVRTSALNGVKGFRGCAKNRVIFFDVANVRVIEGVNRGASKSPVKVISSDIRTLRDGN